MPHYTTGKIVRVGDKVMDNHENEGVVVAVDDATCRCTVDFGLFKVKAQPTAFKQIA